MVSEALQSQITKSLPTSKGFPHQEGEQFSEFMGSDEPTKNFISSKGKRGRKRNKDGEYLEKCFADLDDKSNLLKRANELKLSFSERRRLRN